MNLTERKREEHRSRFMQRAGAVLICISLIISLAEPPRAKAVVGVDDAAIIALVAAFLTSCGYVFYAQNMNSAGVTEQIGVTIDQYAAETGNDLKQGLKDAAENYGAISYNQAQGSIAVSSMAANMLSKFARWFSSKFGLNEGTLEQQVVYSSNAIVQTLEDGTDFKVGYCEVIRESGYVDRISFVSVCDFILIFD